MNKLLATGLAFLLVLPAAAQNLPNLPGDPTGSLGKPGAELPLPFETVGPYKQDGKTTYHFFLYSCPFSGQTEGSFETWAATLPKTVKYESVPVIVDMPSLWMARAYYAALNADPKKINDFHHAAFLHVLQKHGDTETEKAWFEVAQTAGYDLNVFQKTWSDSRIPGQVKQALELAQRYKIEMTPSLAIGGKYLVTPERVGGQYTHLFELANGLVSQILMEN